MVEGRSQHNDHAMYNFFSSLVDIIFKENQQPPASVFISRCNDQVCGYSANNQGERNAHVISKIESFISLQKNILYHVTDELN